MWDEAAALVAEESVMAGLLMKRCHELPRSLHRAGGVQVLLQEAAAGVDGHVEGFSDASIVF